MGAIYKFAASGRGKPGLIVDKYPYSTFWSGTTNTRDLFDRNLAMLISFSTGYQGWRYKAAEAALIRCVRDEPDIVLTP